MKLNNKKGFTIVELVIVIAVIAILAGVLIPTFSTVIENANRSAALQEAKTAMEIVAMEENASLSGSYFVVTGKYVFVYDADGKGITETRPNDFTKKKKEVVAAAANGEVANEVKFNTPDDKGMTQLEVLEKIATVALGTGTGATATKGKAVYYASSAETAYELTKTTPAGGTEKSDYITKTVNGGVATYAVTQTEEEPKVDKYDFTFNEDISTNVIVIGFEPKNA